MKGMRDLQRKISRMEKNLDDNVEGAVQTGASGTVAEAKKNVMGGGNFWRGHLVQNIYVRTGLDGPGVSRTSIVSDAPYSGMLEFGTGMRGDPTAPPSFQYSSPEFSPRLQSSIINWVMTKPNFYGPRTVGVGMDIARTISEEGTFAHPYFRPAWHSTKPTILRNARGAFKRTVRRS